VIRRAMILAAGRGRRLAPLTDHTPKPLVDVGGRPMIERLIAFLRAGGIEQVVINLHHLGDRIVEALGDGRRLGVEIRYSREHEIRDTGGGIRHAESLLAPEPFVVVNGDSLLELPLRAVLEAHAQGGTIATMVVRPDPDPHAWGAVEIDAASRVRRIAGLPRGVDPTALRAFMFPGLHVFEPEIFDWLEPAGAFSITRVTYPRLLEAGRSVRAFVTDARWITIDTAEALAWADRELRERPFRA
jgi:NDP-sugar pyrophosphorylase family protein